MSSNSRQYIPYQPDSDDTSSSSDSEAEELLRTLKQSAADREAASTCSTSTNPGSVAKEEENPDTCTRVAASEDRPTAPPAKLKIDTASSPNDEENPDSEYMYPKTTRQLSCLCWKCHAVLKMPESPKEFCHYAMHVHPVLHVPICSVCSEEVANHQSTCTTTDKDDDDDLCHGCAEPAEPGSSTVMFLCDSCPRQFCSVCVAQAHGGGKQGLAFAQQLGTDEDDWMCLFCDPHPELQKLQEELDTKTCRTRNKRFAGDSLSPHSNASNDDVPPESPPQRTVDQIMEELDWVEFKQRESQQQGDDPAALEAKRAEFAAEIRASKPNLSDGKVQALVEEEIKAWISELARHDERLGDMATSLQEELEVGHGLDLAQVYKQLLGEGANNNRDSGSDEESDPRWKKEADAEIERRNKERGSESVPDISSPSVYEQERYVDVEDLMTKKEDERFASTLGDGFRETGTRPTQGQIDLAYRMEGIVFAENKIRIQRKVDNDMDAREEIEEQKQTSQQGSDGVSRVRRDTYVTMLKARKKKAPPPTRALDESKQDEMLPAERNSNDDTATKNPSRVSDNSKPVPAPIDGVVDLTLDTPAAPPQFKHRPFARNQQEGKVPPPRHQQEVATMEYPSDSDGSLDNLLTEEDWDGSDFFVSSPETYTSEDHKVKTISVCRKLEECLKPHQKEGVSFMWRNVFLDMNVRTSKSQEGIREDKDVGGCILAHSMGLGKSLTTLSLLHTALTHPMMLDQTTRRSMIHTALLIVPKNTLESWRGEIRRWTFPLEPAITPYILADHQVKSRVHVIDQWRRTGGVLLIGKDSFDREVKRDPKLQSPGPDVVVIDEAHLCLSNKTNVLYRALDSIETRRRILLTGTPFQNNVLEYYRMMQFIRPSALDPKESTFDINFAKPIMAGLPSDASVEQRRLSSLKSKQLNTILSSFVHRRDESVLREFLPELTQAVLHIRQTKLQTRMYSALKRYEHQRDQKNFIVSYARSRPIHNHPGCLLMASPDDEAEDASDDRSQSSKSQSSKGSSSSPPWWQATVKKIGEERLKRVHNGGKIVLLLHILTHSIQLKDKVLVFSNCLKVRCRTVAGLAELYTPPDDALPGSPKTLDFIEEILQLPCWTDHSKSLKASFPSSKLGGWKLGKEYLRLDGRSETTKRGSMIDHFNQTEEAQVFLISKAGSVGITLTAANRVVLLDAHFNPTIMNQALFRCYRFGQTKPCYVYRFLTEGTSEEKVYSRSVNKQGLSIRVVDGKSFEGSFTAKELSNLVLNDTWVQCERCEKWRMLKGEEEEDLPEKWYCEMNTQDDVNNTCDASEKDNRWYHKHFQLACVNVGEAGDNAEVVAGGHEYKVAASAGEDDAVDNLDTDDAEAKAAKVKKDVILTKLLDDCSSDESKTSAKISKYYFHDALLAEGKEPTQGDSIEGEDSKPAAKTSGSVHPSSTLSGGEEKKDDGDGRDGAVQKATFKARLEARKRKDTGSPGWGVRNDGDVEQAAKKSKSKKKRASEQLTSHDKAAKSQPKKRSPTKKFSSGFDLPFETGVEDDEKSDAESSGPHLSFSQYHNTTAKRGSASVEKRKRDAVPNNESSSKKIRRKADVSSPSTCNTITTHSQRSGLSQRKQKRQDQEVIELSDESDEGEE